MEDYSKPDFKNTKLTIIYNFASNYRSGIFKKIDQNWNCYWIFGSNKTDIKGMDLSILQNVKLISNKKILGNFYWQKNAISLIRNEETNVLMLGEIYNLSSWLILILNKIRKTNPYIYLWSHGWYGRESLVKKLLKKLYFKLADGIFLYGNYAKKIAISQNFNKPNKLYVIHNSLDHQKQLDIRKNLKSSNIYFNHFSNQYKNIIFIGRLTKSKKISLLLEAIKRLENKNILINLIIVGGGEDEENLKDLTQKLQLKERVWFYGPCYNEKENAELLYNSDLCVSPGNVGLNAVHSMMFGTPVITHNDFRYQGPEFESIVPDKTGDFFIKDSIDDLSIVIENWIKSQNNREIIRQNCYNEIDTNWTPEYQIKILKDIINNQ